MCRRRTLDASTCMLHMYFNVLTWICPCLIISHLFLLIVYILSHESLLVIIKTRDTTISLFFMMAIKIHFIIFKFTGVFVKDDLCKKNNRRVHFIWTKRYHSLILNICTSIWQWKKYTQDMTLHLYMQSRMYAMNICMQESLSLPLWHHKKKLFLRGISWSRVRFGRILKGSSQLHGNGFNS